MKKKFAQIVSLVLLFGMLFVGCGGTQGSSGSDAGQGKEPAAEAKPLEGKHITMCGYAGFVPFRYLEEQADGTQKVVGLDLDILDEMSKRLGFTYSFEDMPFASVIGAVSSGRADIAGSMSYTEERDEVVDFTEPYYYPLLGVFCAKDQVLDSVASLEGKKLAAALGTTNVEFCQQVTGASVKILEGGATWQEVISGRADAYISDGAEVAKTAKENNMSYYVLPLDDATKQYIDPYRFLFKEGSEYRDLFDKELENMKEDGTLNKIIVKWCGEEFTFEDKWDN